MTSNTFRFLLRKGRWNVTQFLSNKDDAIQTALDDLELRESRLSIYKANTEKTNQTISDFEMIGFVFSSTTREYLSPLYYAELDLEELNLNSFELEKSPKGSNVELFFYSDRHYDLINMDRAKCKILAELIFNHLIKNCDRKLPKIKESIFKEIAQNHRKDERLIGLDSQLLHEWALPS